MNPNAKEFVPAYILKKRQDEAVGSLAKQMNDVDLDESKKNAGSNGETSCDNQNSKRAAEQHETQASSQDGTTNSAGGDPSDSNSESSKVQHNSSKQTNERSKTSSGSNQQRTQNSEEDDRYLLKKGENYCEFNGEQFIIPGDDDEYENDNGNANPALDNSHHSYDFGNPEDNEDEDVKNAYDAFLNELP